MMIKVKNALDRVNIMHTIKRLKALESCFIGIIANSYLAEEMTAITMAILINNEYSPNSSGVYNRAITGTIKIDITCPAVVPVNKVITFFKNSLLTIRFNVIWIIYFPDK